MKEIYLEFSKALLLTLESVFNNFHTNVSIASSVIILKNIYHNATNRIVGLFHNIYFYLQIHI